MYIVHIIFLRFILFLPALPSGGLEPLYYHSVPISLASQNSDESCVQAIQETAEITTLNEGVTSLKILDSGYEAVASTGIKSSMAVNQYALNVHQEVQTTSELTLPSQEVGSQEQLPTTTDVGPAEQLQAQEVEVNGLQTAVHAVEYSPTASRKSVSYQVVDNRYDDVIMCILFDQVSTDLYNAVKNEVRIRFVSK